MTKGSVVKTVVDIERLKKHQKILICMVNFSYAYTSNAAKAFIPRLIWVDVSHTLWVSKGVCTSYCNLCHPLGISIFVLQLWSILVLYLSNLVCFRTQTYTLILTHSVKFSWGVTHDIHNTLDYLLLTILLVIFFIESPWSYQLWSTVVYIDDYQLPMCIVRVTRSSAFQ